ncbi:MAG: hydroxymethylglutaryl-CoA lyase [Endozoicomonadaceae bacterium]|nr:hydroxymethylglutaryl-CoA lyase [Endozoicomonadaceae bacterium]
MDAFPDEVTVFEVGPRDGLQNQKKTLSVKTRIQFIDKLSAAGFKYIEAGSFVSSEKVPQMANTDQVLTGINRHRNCAYPVLTPNLQGLENALNAGATHIAIFGSASEQFCRKNINCSVAESMVRFRDILQAAKQHQLIVRAYLSCVMGCPYEGEVAANKTASLAEQLLTMGCYEISLGDTIGIGTPGQVTKLLRAVKAVLPVNKIAVHFHDTYGQALANIYTALMSGVAVIDASVAGLGGCPYAPGASGNIATEDIVYMLNGLGITTKIDLNTLLEASYFICRELNCSNQSKVAVARQSL